MTREPDWATVDRWLAGEATADDERALREWAAADPSHAAWLDGLRAGSRAPESGWNVNAAWARVAARTTEGAGPVRDRLVVARGAPARAAVRTTRPRQATWWTRAAAAALLVVGAGAVWRATAGREAPTVATAESATRELVAARGGRAETRLVDGTRVVLNAGSRLRYAPDYGTASGRDVWLDGEGYFEVEHDAARPFRVHAGRGVAEDLGTRFVVRAYPELPHVEVMVAEGRVSLRREGGSGGARGDSAVLGAGQLGRLDASGALSTQSAVGAERYLGWTTGTLVLEDLRLRDALPLLERRYDLAIRLADGALGDRRVVARFRDQTADEVLDALALALGARYERRGREVTFRLAATP